MSTDTRQLGHDLAENIKGLRKQFRAIYDLATSGQKRRIEDHTIEGDAPLTVEIARNDLLALFALLDVRMTGLVIALKRDGEAPLSSKDLQDGNSMCRQIKEVLDKLTFLVGRLFGKDRAGGDDSTDNFTFGKYFLREMRWKIQTVAERSEHVLRRLNMVINVDGDKAKSGSIESGRQGLEQHIYTSSSILSQSLADSATEIGAEAIGEELSKDNWEATAKSLASSEELICDALDELEDMIRYSESKEKAENQEASSDESDPDERSPLRSKDLQRAKLIVPLVRLARLSLRKCIQRRVPLLARQPPIDSESNKYRSQELDTYADLAAELVSSLDDLISEIGPGMQVETLRPELEKAMSVARTLASHGGPVPRLEPNGSGMADHSSDFPSSSDEHEKWFDMAISQLDKMQSKLYSMLE